MFGLRRTRRPIFRCIPLCLAVLIAALAARPAAAMTEFCMTDGDDVQSTFFAAPTTDTTPVRVVMAGYTYNIPRNYFRFPQVECRTGETRGIALRMTLPDFLPATRETWDRLYGRSAGVDDKYIEVSGSQRIIRDMPRLLQSFARFEIPDRTAPPVKGLSSFLQGPLDPDGYPVSDVYYAPTRDRPQVVIYCTPVHLPYDSSCVFLFPHSGLVWSPWTNRKNLPQWHKTISGLKLKIDSFIVQH